MVYVIVERTESSMVYTVPGDLLCVGSVHQLEMLAIPTDPDAW